MAAAGALWRRDGTGRSTVRHALRLPGRTRRALVAALEHDALNLAQSAAYSAMVALFPALIVAAAAVALLPNAAALRSQVGEFFDQVLPATVFPVLTAYFASSPASPHTTRSIVLAAVVSLLSASGTVATLMEGLRRAEDLPNDAWSFGQRRVRALLLVPLSLAPLGVATLLVVFGEWITAWLAGYLLVAVRPAFYAFTLALRWTVSLAGVASLTALIYSFGTPAATPGNANRRRQDWSRATTGRWARALPGAVVATALWFVSTLIFGWYVTRFANYGQVYGSLGAGIALLFWLYLVFLSVLVGAEFNAQAASRARTHPAEPSPPNPLG